MKWYIMVYVPLGTTDGPSVGLPDGVMRSPHYHSYHFRCAMNGMEHEPFVTAGKTSNHIKLNILCQRCQHLAQYHRIIGNELVQCVRP